MPEILSQAQGRVRCHAALSRHNLIEAVGRHFDNIGKPFRRKPVSLQLVANDFSGVNGCAVPWSSPFRIKAFASVLSHQ